LAARSPSDELLAELQRVIQQQRELSGSLSNLGSQAELDVRFHTLIAEASGNDIAEEIVGRIVPAFCDSNRAVLYLRASTQQTLKEHQCIIDALASKDPAKAEAAMRAHIARVRSDIQNLCSEDEASDVI